MNAQTPHSAIHAAVDFSAASMRGPAGLLLKSCAVIVEDAGNVTQMSDRSQDFGVVALVAAPSADVLAASESLATAVESSITKLLNELCPQSAPWLVRVFASSEWRSIKGYH